MSHVYMGRILDIFGERDQAIEHYRAALDTGETSPVIRGFSEQGIAEPFTGMEDEDEGEDEP